MPRDYMIRIDQLKAEADRAREDPAPVATEANSLVVAVYEVGAALAERLEKVAAELSALQIRR